ncbi:hypothetical protein PtA15_8A529 [Puccinia triticina]|uniref:Signal recognition particle-docking protein FtsY n=1 Tax=Puccinia triticina TaxID=208348 RepID=A0ABY7CSI5_9BASI|nr:uncharacterized protein PtA15_8A529 [Puccinia triticina]WAQ87624.1 hypothetical protein PtA15_8A529 [Puccinia triticina]
MFSPAVEAVEASLAKAAAAPAETPEEAKVEKKENSPKDLAKLAQRFSGRLFGAVGKKKKEPTKKPEPTQEEEAKLAAPAEPAPVSDAAPQIPANTTPEVSQAATKPAPVFIAIETELLENKPSFSNNAAFRAALHDKIGQEVVRGLLGL